MNWQIVKERIKDKNWIKTQCPNCKQDHWVSFEFLYNVIKGIGECEDEKYPNGEGRHMVTRFITDVLETQSNFEDLRIKYKIPLRNKQMKEVNE